MDKFQALAEPTRREIIEMLAKHGQLSASDIQVHFHVTAPAISQHLKVLRETKLVSMKKQAQRNLYQINPDAIYDIESWAKQMTNLWQQRFDRLEKILEQKTVLKQKG